MTEPIQVPIETANALYQEGGDYMKARVLRALKAELERHRKGSSGYATVEQLIEKVLEIPVND